VKYRVRIKLGTHDSTSVHDVPEDIDEISFSLMDGDGGINVKVDFVTYVPAAPNAEAPTPNEKGT
jgi:hypothetical protein